MTAAMAGLVIGGIVLAGLINFQTSTQEQAEAAFERTNVSAQALNATNLIARETREGTVDFVSGESLTVVKPSGTVVEFTVVDGTLARIEGEDVKTLVEGVTVPVFAGKDARGNDETGALGRVALVRIDVEASTASGGTVAFETAAAAGR